MPGDFNIFGKTLIGVGILIILIGMALIFSDKIPWLGRLPGDIHIKKENWSFYFPIATSLLISVILSLILWLFKR
ncbi:DUF2905 domain-containing protein [bacterium]|nr:DUF2905 domain-containing protein [bacterium]